VSTVASTFTDLPASSHEHPGTEDKGGQDHLLRPSEVGPRVGRDEVVQHQARSRSLGARTTTPAANRSTSSAEKLSQSGCSRGAFRCCAARREPPHRGYQQKQPRRTPEGTALPTPCIHPRRRRP